MKRILPLIFFFGLLSCHFNKESEYLSGISVLPSFDMQLVDSLTLFHAKDIPKGKPIVMVYFRPDCPHCQLETKNLVKSIDRFKDCRIYFLTSSEFENIKSFARDFRLDQYPSIITMAKDHDHSFARIFQPSSIPFLAIYDRQKKLAKVYHGEVPMENLLAVIHD